MTLVRRSLVLAAFLFWQGGFTFYAAVVIPAGREVLGSHRQQGFVTRKVTNGLNAAGAVALPLLAWDAAVCRAGRRGRWLTCAGMAATLGLLVWMHPRLDALLDAESLHVLDGAAFYTWHRAYLWVTAAQWLCALTHGVLTLRAWREEDRGFSA